MQTWFEIETARDQSLGRTYWPAVLVMLGLTGGLAVGAAVGAAELGPLPDQRSAATTEAETALFQAIDRQLELPTPAEIAAARQRTVEALARLNQTLADQAVGPLLTHELRLVDLQHLLAKLSPAHAPARTAAVEAFLPVLRRVLPGQAQADLDQLRQEVAALAASCSRSSVTIAAARRAVATLHRHRAVHPARYAPDDDRQLRDAFASVVRLVARNDLRSQLRQTLSQPNAIVQLSPRFVQQLTAQRVTRPINLQQAAAGTVITGQGDVQIDLSAELPESVGCCRVIVHAEGRGQIDATASRRRARVTATAAPTVSGLQPIIIDPRTITPAAAALTATMHTQLKAVSISGLLGHCRLIRRLATRSVERQLAAADPAAARAIEAEVGRTVEAEGLLLAGRINTLLAWGVWNRLAAIDFTPEVLLANTQAGATSRTFYAQGRQLAATAPPPVAAAEQSPRVAMVTKVHESAVNNLFAGFGGLTLDEATIRALWEVQLKLSDADWERLPPARVASTITLHAEQPLEVRVANQEVQLTLRPAAGHLAGMPLSAAPAVISLSYQLKPDADGLCFRRTACQFSGNLDAATAAAWTELTDLFCGRLLRPLPRYRTGITASWLRVVHAALEQGWLVVVTEMIDDEPPSVGSF